MGLITLLEPTVKEGTILYEKWDVQLRSGGFIDIGRARIFGSEWYGASANWAIPMLTRSIAENRRAEAFHILMLHTDVEGHQVHPIPALSIDALKQLRSAVGYVALGHTHKHYEIDNWAFNPGSIEVTNISEFRETRGAFIVEIDQSNRVIARHVQDYLYRPFQRIEFQVTGYSDPKDVTADILDRVSREVRTAEPGKPKPIVEIALRGQLGFPNSLLEMQKIRDEAKAIADVLHVRIRNHTVPLDYVEANADFDDSSREKLERSVVRDLIIRDNRFSGRPDEVAEAVVGAKRMALSDEPPEKIADFISIKACQNS